MVVGSSIDKVYMVMDFGGMDLKVRIWFIIIASTSVAINHSFTNISLLYRCTTLIYRYNSSLIYRYKSSLIYRYKSSLIYRYKSSLIYRYNSSLLYRYNSSLIYRYKSSLIDRYISSLPLYSSNFQNHNGNPVIGQKG